MSQVHGHKLQCVRAIILRDNKLLSVSRNKYGKHYFVLPGGHVDPGETREQALERELMEETGLRLLSHRLVIIEASAPGGYGPQYVYLCEVEDREPMLSPDSDEARMNEQGENTYTLAWLPFEELEELPIYSPMMAQAVISGIKDGFPETPKTI